MTEQREEYTKGLRLFADLLDENPGFPLPWDGGVGTNNSQRITFYALSNSEDPLGVVNKFIKLIPGKLEKEFSDRNFNLLGSLAGLHLKVTTERAAVCERVVTGTKTVVHTPVPAQRGYTEEVEEVEWICAPLLADKDD